MLYIEVVYISRYIYGKSKIKWKTGQKLKDYLKKEFDWSNHKKYRVRFEEWYSNLTENQLLYYEAYSRGAKTPWQIGQ